MIEETRAAYISLTIQTPFGRTQHVGPRMRLNEAEEQAAKLRAGKPGDDVAIVDVMVVTLTSGWE